MNIKKNKVLIKNYASKLRILILQVNFESRILISKPPIYHSFFQIIIYCLLITPVFISCEKSIIEQPGEKILVKINDTLDISINEFIRRAEYTVRPPYCKQNSYLHKKIILNSLIAEKLFALETGFNNPLFKNVEFQNYIKGRTEQAMRQWMHHQEATAKVELDTTEIKKAYPYIGREYEVEYFIIDDSSFFNEQKKKLQNDSNFFDELFRENSKNGSSISKRQISWGAHESEQILKALYSENLLKNQVLKSIKISNNKFLIMRIKGWKDNKAITENQIQQRLNNVSETLTQLKASSIWNDVVGKIMKGKQIDFNQDTFEKVSSIFFNIYFDDKRTNVITENILDQERDTQKALDALKMQDILNQPFFEIDGKTWYVSDFRTELMSHPLVFREFRIPSHEFSKEFKMAIVNLVEDHYITKEAYKKGYDKINVVQRNKKMWRDSFLALYHKEKYLRSVNENRNFSKNYMKIIEEKLNDYVDCLQNKYHKKIEVDFTEFEKIVLTSIDLFVKQPKKPYKLLVPLFPTITTDSYLEYVTKMKG